MAIVIPRKREYWQRKPSGNLRLNPYHPALEGIGRGDFFDFREKDLSGLANGLNLTPRTETSITVSTDYGAGEKYHGNTSQGSYIGGSGEKLAGWGEMSIFSVVKMDSFPTGSPEGTILRYTSTSSQGVSLSFMSGGAIRALISTTGASIWTAGQDASGPVLHTWILVGLSWDGSSRTIYYGELGDEISALRSDTCNGTVIDGGSAAYSILTGGLPSNSLSINGTALFTVLKEAPTSLSDINLLSENIGALYQPRRRYWVVPEVAAPTGFEPAWARNTNRLYGGGFQ